MTNQHLDLLRGSALLSKSDFEFIEGAAAELQDTLLKRQVFRTETEMQVSVLNDIKFPTAASKYWQAVREQAVMLEQLIMLGFDYRRNAIAIKRLLKDIAALEDDLTLAEKQVDLDECYFKQSNMEINAKDRIREIRLWSKIKTSFDDGSFDTKDVNTHQLVSYARRFILQASNAPSNMPVAEANNLMGQLTTTLRELKQRGLLDDREVVEQLPPDVIAKVFGSSVQLTKEIVQ